MRGKKGRGREEGRRDGDGRREGKKRREWKERGKGRQWGKRRESEVKGNQVKQNERVGKEIMLVATLHTLANLH